MNYQKEFENSKEEVQNKLAEGLPTLIRNINNKKQIVEYLRNMKNEPSVNILNRINKIAIKKEDYETCEALNIYSKEREIILKTV